MFSGVSRQGDSKTPQKYFCKQVHVEKKIRKINKNFDLSFSSNFFLSCFRVFLSEKSSKTHKKRLAKKHRFENILQKIRPKIQNRFFLDLFLSRFWAFLGEGSKKIRPRSLFCALIHPPTTGVTDSFCFCRPLDLRRLKVLSRGALPSPPLTSRCVSDSHNAAEKASQARCRHSLYSHHTATKRVRGNFKEALLWQHHVALPRQSHP
jgi:hypothetical protein